MLRGTDEYAKATSEPVWPPFIDAELEQMERGDIPYFFRRYGKTGIRRYVDRALRRTEPTGVRGDRVLSLARGLRSPSRAMLRGQGMFTVLGAFDHAALRGKQEEGAFAVTFGARTLAIELPSGEELRAPRDLRDVVGSVYLPCRCGEVSTVFA
jgi:hypothetical protein